MKNKLINTASMIICLLSLQISVLAQETDADSAVLTMKTFGPANAGTVTPSDVWSVYQAGDVVNISATANSGFSFSGWTISGQGTLGDYTSADTTVTLNGNSIVTANFIKTDNTLTGQLKVTVSPDGAGNVTPAADTTINIGQIQAITAVPTGTYKFLKWTVEGAAALDDPYSPTTNVVIKGDVTLTANFAETADTVALELEAGAADAGGTIQSAGTYSMVKGTSRTIKAVPDSGYIFTGWVMNGLSVLDSEHSPETTITVYEATTISANFAKNVCTYSHQGRRITIRKTDGSYGYVRNRDSVNIKFLPMCLNSNDFNPTTDTIQVFIDGITVTINKNNGRFTRNSHGYRYRSFSRTGDYRIVFILDFTRGVWSFRASRINLAGLDNTDGIAIMMYVNGNYYGQKYDMGEKVSWQFNIKNNTSESIDSPGTDMQSYSISRMRGNYRNDKDGRDSLVISKAELQLPSGYTFDPATENVSLNIAGEAIIIPSGSFEEVKDNSFIYNNKEEKIKLKLDFNKEKWSLTYKAFSGWGDINPDESMKVYLQIGDSQSGLNIIPSFTRTFKYNYKKFYWRK